MSKRSREDFSEDSERHEYVADGNTNNTTSLELTGEIG